MSMHILRAKLSAHIGKAISERTLLNLITEHTDITADNTIVIHDINAVKNVSPTGITVVYIDIGIVTYKDLDNIVKQFTDAEHVILRSSSIIGSGQLFISTVSSFDLKLFVVLVTQYEPGGGFLFEWDKMIPSHNKLCVFHQDVKFQRNQIKGLINLIALSDEQGVDPDSDSDSESEGLFIPDAAIAFSNLDDVPLLTLEPEPGYQADMSLPPNYPPPPPPQIDTDIDDSDSDSDSDLAVDSPDPHDPHD